MHKWVSLVGVLVTLLTSPGALWAFPGHEQDEQCEALVQQAVELAAAQGTQAVEPDCILNVGLSATAARAAEREMALAPVPNVRQVPLNEEVVFARRFVRVYEGANLHDAPGGNITRQMGGGLTLVSYRIWREDGWILLNSNEWVRSEDTRTYDISTFSGVEINAPLERPLAWVLAHRARCTPAAPRRPTRHHPARAG
ncbi:MAG: hypothetical protein HC915_19755 [Anaerolineae bacterium]|nr:hypothetical protein [Anaerolineae bacterium]